MVCIAMIHRIDTAWKPVANRPNDMRGSIMIDPCTPRPRGAEPYVPPSLVRAIAARWKHWVPWVRMYLLRACQSDPSVNPAMDSPDSRRLRQRHSEHILDMLRAGISMRTIRRHRLDDPRLTGELRVMLVAATKDRQGKAWYRRPEEQRQEDRLRRLMTLGPAVDRAATTGSEAGPPGGNSQAATLALDLLAVPVAIQAIRKHVCEHFYLREMRDPELTVRTNRRAYVLPHQIAMYIARQLTGASLQVIGREFANRHHTTTLYSIRKIEGMRRSDGALDGAISGLMDDIALRLADIAYSSTGVP